MKRIGILSDTHGHWDDKFMAYFKDCDEVWHAGDVGDFAILERLRESVPVVRAVSGNIDHGMVRRKCSESLVFDVESVRVLLTHIGGYPGRWAPGFKKRIMEEKPGLVITGHSHILRIMYDRDLSLLHVNPGASGHAGWHKVRTLVRLTIDGAVIRDCEVIELA